MANSQNPFAYGEQFTMAAEASVDERADFLVKTYLHLLGAVLAFAGVVTVILHTPALLQPILQFLTIPYGALLLMVGFLAVSWIASSWASTATSVPMQYAGLGLYVVAEAIIFTPLLFVAEQMGDGVIQTAGAITVLLFVAMTAIVYTTRKNFSFLGPALAVGGIAAIAIIFCALIFQFPLGPIFSVAMIALACGYILFHTSNILHEYAVGQHVAAALALFASVALLFWYVLRIVMQSRD